MMSLRTHTPVSFIGRDLGPTLRDSPTRNGPIWQELVLGVVCYALPLPKLESLCSTFVA